MMKERKKENEKKRSDFFNPRVKLNPMIETRDIEIIHLDGYTIFIYIFIFLPFLFSSCLQIPS